MKTEEEETRVQKTRYHKKTEATARATQRRSYYGKENPQKFRLFTRQVAGSSQTASDGPQKVDASVHCSQPQGLSHIENICGLEKKRNNLRDFLNVAGPMGVTHFFILSKTATSPYLRVATTPQGPTLTFKIHEYSLAADIARSQLHPRCPKDLFKSSALIVLSGFVSGDPPLQLTTNMFQNIFPTIDVKTVKLSTCQRIVLLNYNKDTKLIDFRHYSIRLQPVGVSRRIRKLVQSHQVPDLRNLLDVSNFVTKAGYGSESEADEEAATVTLSSDIGRVNRASTKSAVKLHEVGPRMTLQLVRIEKGLCSGEVLFSEYGKAGGKGKSDDEMQGEEDEEDQDGEHPEDSED
ncbi:Peter Pan-like protein isoform D [Glycine soja]|uniref:Peter Pan-like protein isoform D n=1 Tax=Glycine soja TaxID=3848 RepID=A0A445HZK8_GLYSO|nr:Peter Pan-like protein isoform D [Glycine soja]